MKIYLVGGAVRDELLQLPVQERDWVVVGATPEAMLKKGFRQVGRDFPVFLHPETQEEYALARKERKSARGYYGFDCEYDASIRLEEDLSRRDLTINAIAKDEQGNLIDPFNGVADLCAKKLRHVSSAFVEDPVRVLRVARFAARFHHLGFTVAEETRRLMYEMVTAGELQHLVAERVWQEWERSFAEKHPECFISTLRASGALAIILPEIDKLFGVPSAPHYHPEVDSGIHTLMVLEAISALTKDPMTRFAALTHDLGKAETNIEDWPSHHGHEEKGVAIITALARRLKIPTKWHQLATLVSRQHLNIHRLFELRANTIVNILEQSNAFRQSDIFDKLLVACEADAGGAPYEQAKGWRSAQDACLAINPQDFIVKGMSGIVIKNELHARRVAKVHELLSIWKEKI